MTTPNPNAQEFTEGFKSGFHEGVEQAREEFKKKSDENKPEDKKGDEDKKKEAKKQGPIRERIGKIVRSRTFQIIAVIIVVIAIALFLYYASKHESTDDAYTVGHIHNIASRVAGTVLEVKVDDNERVKQGDILVVLDPTDYQVLEAQAEADYEKAVADDERAKKLLGSGAISKQDYDQFSATRKVDLAKLQDAKNQLAYTVIRAPANGRIAHKSVETGNRIGVGAALMAVVEDIWVVANFKETQMGKMRVGQKATIKIDAIPGKTFRGYVDSWSPGSGSVFALLPPDNSTGNFTKIVQRVPVKIRFDPDSIRDYEQRFVPGLSCEPDVLLDGGDPNRSSPVRPQIESIPPDAGR